MDVKKRSQPRKIPVIKDNHPARTDNEEKSKKTASSMDIPVMTMHFDELAIQEPLRRRSRSAPMSLEATGVADKLRQLSDSFQSTYEQRNKKRRVTVSGRMSDKRLSWPAWNTFIEEEVEDGVFPHSSSLPASAGTSV